ncbi:MAG: hypothetical protein KJ718_00595 [Nanoarchaeota archaeon]|nr:hypothetical protein [Nanoarchaeota archaeon]MBU1051039.1 hypothetical protein [Nanoarchaeota archaeon]MBU1989039.1 hypothetical protein [Nanoarchaeota archaeon]
MTFTLQEIHYQAAMTRVFKDNFDAKQAIRVSYEMEVTRPRRTVETVEHRLVLGRPFGNCDVVYSETASIIPSFRFYKTGKGEEAIRSAQTAQTSEDMRRVWANQLGTFDPRYQLRFNEKVSVRPTQVQQMKDFAKFMELAALDIARGELNGMITELMRQRDQSLPEDTPLETFGWS